MAKDSKVVSSEGRRMPGVNADWWDMERGALPWLNKHEPFHENKQSILDSLFTALVKTRQYWNLLGLEYDQKTETVTAYFLGGGKRIINVNMDGGAAMIRDVLGHLG